MHLGVPAGDESVARRVCGGAEHGHVGDLAEYRRIEIDRERTGEDQSRSSGAHFKLDGGSRGRDLGGDGERKRSRLRGRL